MSKSNKLRDIRKVQKSLEKSRPPKNLPVLFYSTRLHKWVMVTKNLKNKQIAREFVKYVTRQVNDL